MSNMSISNPHFYIYESLRQVDEQGIEFWHARDLMPFYHYSRWNNFDQAIERAKTTCRNSGIPVEHHFCATSRKTKGRPAADYKLSRYACYVVAMNGDTNKEPIAAAQTYFAAKAREAELAAQSQVVIASTAPAQLSSAQSEQLMIIERRQNDLAALQSELFCQFQELGDILLSQQKENSLQLRAMAAQQAELKAQVDKQAIIVDPDATRSAMRQMVSIYAYHTDIREQRVWFYLYTTLRYRLHVNFPAKENKLDYLKRQGLLPKAFLIFRELLAPDANGNFSKDFINRIDLWGAPEPLVVGIPGKVTLPATN